MQVISVEKLSKRYRLGGLEPYQTLRDVIARRFRGDSSASSGGAKYHWALEDVSFDVRAGEVLGIIGRNGAGKSTLLKILSEITRPTSGRVVMRGRVGTLLEVGTGFHPELTGRENVFLNGSILGMSRNDIRRKFDQIVDFAGVDEYLDTPVKRYSSGMKVRLAFAVAAHLEPEILVIDEVLAVGDAEFQRKCLGRMNEVAGEGRTVLFVSHQMEAVQSLCTRAVWLENGQVRTDGNVSQIVTEYLQTTVAAGESVLANEQTRSGTGDVRVTRIELRSASGQVLNAVPTGAAFSIEMYCRFNAPKTGGLRVAIKITDEFERPLVVAQSAGELVKMSADESVISCALECLPLKPGRYYIHFGMRIMNELADKLAFARSIDVVPSDYLGSAEDLQEVGLVACRNQWSTRKVQRDHV